MVVHSKCFALAVLLTGLIALAGCDDGPASALDDGALDALARPDGPVDGSVDGLDGSVDGMEGTTDGMADSMDNGISDGTVDSMTDGTADAITADAITDAVADALPDALPDAAPGPRAPSPPVPAGRVSPLAACDPGELYPAARCEAVRVEVDGLPPADAELRVEDPVGAPRGVIVFGSGTGGGQWVFDTPAGALAGLRVDLLAAGYTLVERRWGRTGGGGGWFAGGEGGVALHAARYALLAAHIDATLVPAGAPLCVTGNSGGSVELGFALGAWDLGARAALVVPTSGPLDDLRDACWGDTHRPAYRAWCEGWYDQALERGETTCAAGARTCELVEGTHDLISAAFGEGEALCGPADDTPAAPSDDDLARLGADGPPVPTRGADAVVRVLLGDQDCSGVVPQGAAWAERLAGAGVDAEWRLLPGTRHNVLRSAAAADAFRGLIDAHCR